MRRPRRNNSTKFKSGVALAALQGEGTVALMRRIDELHLELHLELPFAGSQILPDPLRLSVTTGRYVHRATTHASIDAHHGDRGHIPGEKHQCPASGVSASAEKPCHRSLEPGPGHGHYVRANGQKLCVSAGGDRLGYTKGTVFRNKHHIIFAIILYVSRALPFSHFSLLYCFAV